MLLPKLREISKEEFYRNFSRIVNSSGAYILDYAGVIYSLNKDNFIRRTTRYNIRIKNIPHFINGRYYLANHNRFYLNENRDRYYVPYQPNKILMFLDKGSK